MPQDLSNQLGHADREGLVGHREGSGGPEDLLGHGDLKDLVGLAGLGDPDWHSGPVGPGALVDFGPFE